MNNSNWEENCSSQKEYPILILYAKYNVSDPSWNCRQQNYNKATTQSRSKEFYWGYLHFELRLYTVSKHSRISSVVFAVDLSNRSSTNLGKNSEYVSLFFPF